MKKKHILSVVIFSIVFGFLFFRVQKIINYKGWPEDIVARYEQYEKESKEAPFDVLLTGSSPVYADIQPMILWNAEGIRSFNFGISMNTALMMYYQIRNLFEICPPKVVVVDAANFFVRDTTDSTLQDPLYETRYRINYETLPNRQLAEEFLEEALKTNENMNKFNWWFPLFRYHDRWSELEKIDFISGEDYAEYYKGGFRGGATTAITPDTELWKTSPVEPYDFMIEYYEKIVELCKEYDVEMLMVMAPKKSSQWRDEHNQIVQEWCNQNSVEFVSYMTDDEFERLGLNAGRDFYDSATSHLNIRGQMKLSVDFASKLQELYHFEDKRNDAQFQSWNEDYQLFIAPLQDFLNQE